MTWSGGNCPACGEEMPAGVVRCRYCHASLVATDSQNSNVADADGEAEVLAAATENESMLATAKHASSNPQQPRKAQKGKDRTVTAPTPSRTQNSPVSGAQGTVAKAASVVAAESVSPQPSLVEPDPYASTWTQLLWVVAALLLAPLCVSGPVPGAGTPLSYFVKPMVHSGDEPHYLVLINSVIRDGDIDVVNNYADVHQGGDQAGRKFAGWALDHHVNWYWQTHLIHWWQAYEMQSANWQKDADGHPIPTLQAKSIHRPVNSHEYSQHPPGLAWVLAPVVWPFRSTSLVEPVVLLYSGMATIAGLWAFFLLIRTSGVSVRAAVLLTAVTFLGTPLWHFARTLYAEPYLMACAVGGYAAGLRYKRFGIVGVLLGIGTLIKIPFVVIALPLITDAAFEKRWRDVVYMAIPVAIAVGLQFVCNQSTFGNWWKFPQKWEWGYPLFGLGGLAFSWQHGLLLFAPIVLVSLLLAVPKWFRQQRREAIVMGSAAMLYILTMACWAQWWGGTSYSARLIMPVVPFLMLPLGALIGSPTWSTNVRLRALTWSTAVVSVVFGVVGAFSCEHIWNKHPLQMLFHN